MKRIIALAILATSLTGCLGTIGVVQWVETETTVDGYCKGIVWTIGEQATGCTGGGAISPPGAGMVGAIFTSLADMVSGFFGRAEAPTINVVGTQPAEDRPSGAPRFGTTETAR
jgi:hypothetical protein